MDEANIIANSLTNQWNYSTKPVTPQFIKLTDTTLGEIIINTSAITFINPGRCDICVTNTDGESGGGMLRVTKESMTKLLNYIDFE